MRALGEVRHTFLLLVFATGCSSVPDSIDPEASTVTLDRTTATADGRDRVIALVRIIGSNGQPRAAVPVTLMVSGEASTVDPPRSTDSSGQVTFALTSTRSGLKAVTVLAESVVLAARPSVLFVSGGLSRGRSSFEVTPSVVEADGVSEAKLHVTARDENDNPIAELPVLFGQLPAGVTLSADFGVTDASGRFSTALTSTVREEVRVVAFIGEARLEAVARFVEPAPSPGTSTIVALPTTVTADGRARTTVVVTLRDRAGRAVPGVPVATSVSGTGNRLTQGSGTSDDTGQFTTRLSSSVAEMKQVTAISGTVTLATSITFVPLPAPPLRVFVEGLTTGDVTLATPDLPDLTIDAGVESADFARRLELGTPYRVTVKSVRSGGGLVCPVVEGQSGTAGPGLVTARVRCVRNGWTAVVAGGDSTLALRTDGSLWGWGANGEGQLGLGDTQSRPRATRVGLESWRRVALGKTHALAIRADGTLWSWGSNARGQRGWTGDGGWSPGQIGVASDWIDVAAGSQHSLALRGDGALWAWGEDGSGQLGQDGGSSEPRPPSRIGEDSDWSQIAAGADFSVALKRDGTLWSWGSWPIGRAGGPAQLGADLWTAVAAGRTHALAIRQDGSLWAWGSNFSGELGREGFGAFDVPIRVGAERDWLAVSAGDRFSAGVRTDGGLWMWGSNAERQLCGTSGTSTSTPTKVASDEWVQVSSGASHTALLRSDGTVWTCGSEGSDQLGQDRGIPSVRPADRAFSELATSQAHGLALAVDGTLWAQGENDHGQCGVGTRERLEGLTPVDGGFRWIAMSTGGYHSSAIREDGTWWAWGNPPPYREAIHFQPEAWSPALIDGAGVWTQVTTGLNFLTGLKADGSAWTMGVNWDESLGTGQRADTFTSPTSILAGAPLAMVGAGFMHSVALRRDGVLLTWGQGDEGQLGTGLTLMRTPGRVNNEADWSSVFPGGWATMALKRDGSLWAWGHNRFGQLGDGTLNNRNVPGRVAGARAYVDGSMGPLHSAAIQSDGTLWAWGSNGAQQLGDGTRTSRLAPGQVGTATSWRTVRVGWGWTMALREDGSLWTWGTNGLGELGRTERPQPVW